ncbi:DUF1266 domain-containing protein [Streptomyces sp. SAJ15]|uniref:DUF1266 domain-containing protein n=1 Tax=Streptomyces sp. SAJ15 TaxID=2011095 RepID=UPI0011859AB9|nr:DUF1266 domain-containing protein [Streptomyces sp. SAJ15]TVL88754.1 hypothetical protein CD790_29865 [Streptomyces sp. SAJ15]
MHGEDVQDVQHDEILPFIALPEDGGTWTAPTEFEQRLYALSERTEADDDAARYAYLRLLATEGLYRPVDLSVARSTDGQAPLHAPALDDGRRIVQVYTAGVLPRPHPDVVYEFITLGSLALIWPEDCEILVVNGGTPCEHWFLADEEEREVWGDLHEDLYEPDGTGDRVVTRRTGAPEDPDMLLGLACGAHLCYANGDAWNTLDWHGAGYHNEVERLVDSWGVEGRDDWLGVQERLLTREVSPWYWDLVLRARNDLIRELGHPRVDPVLWRDWVEAVCRDRVQARSEADLEEFVAFARDLVGKVMRYEARFRADGLLPPDGHVRTVAAWDLGRASKMARWGRGARYATEPEMHAAIARVGVSVRGFYESWEDFSAGYILGRCLHFDEEHFGPWYTSVLLAHRILLVDPHSPWATVPLR